MNAMCRSLPFTSPACGGGRERSEAGGGKSLGAEHKSLGAEQVERPPPRPSPASGRGGRRRGTLIFITTLIGVAAPALAAEIPLADRKSGYDLMGRETRAMQDDDTANPGMLWVLDGETLWNRKDGDANKSCADCHGEAAASMNGVAARYPAFDAARGMLFDLEARINASRTEHQKAPALAFESKALLALTAYVGRQSRGMPIAIKDDAQTRSAVEAGRKRFELRQGQLNLSCAQCHDDNWGQRLAAAPIPQAHPNGYPLYRLEWQSLGSLQRRLRNCISGMRAENYSYGASELVELELYLMWRARGLTIETPAVRP
jgi:sulfur-oxidizing protein SoxA